MSKSKMRGDMVCPFCIENDEWYRVSASNRKDANDLMKGHIKKHHISSQTSGSGNK